MSQFDQQVSTVFFCDFDGTIASQDIGDLILDHLVEGRREFTFPKILGEIGSKKAYLGDYQGAKFTLEQLQSLVATVPIDPGFTDLLRAVRDRGDLVAVVSDGFDKYIKLFMERFDIAGILVFCNEMRIDSMVELGFPHHNSKCGFCGNCKSGVVASFPDDIRKVYVGDGTSDVYPVRLADVVFAKGRLAETCEREGIPFNRFESFSDIAAMYRNGWNGVISNQRSVHPKCASFGFSICGKDWIDFVDLRRAGGVLRAAI